MISEMLSIKGTIGALLFSLFIFGLAPGFVLAAIVRLIPDLNRRQELQAELYEIPRLEQPYWVVQQLEVAIRVGLSPQVSWFWSRHVWHRCRIESGVERNSEYPETFDIPDQEAKAYLGPGDKVKLMWSVARMPGERMWVTITQRKGDRLVGVLDNWAVSAFLYPEEIVKFHIDDVIDCIFEDDESEDEAAA